MELIYSGKVRDIYDLGDERLFMVASDRLSAFDVVLDEPILHKGRVLTALSTYWFSELSDIAPNHLVDTDPAAFPSDAPAGASGRAMVVRRAKMLPIECIVRGYLSGSAWKEYQQSGTIHSMAAPSGLVESDRLPEPMFTPSTKAESGHDENIDYDQAVALVGGPLADRARQICLAAYERGAQRAADQGIIMADTKFELGLIDGELALCDELLTPDSSRFWPADSYVPGRTCPSFDKQPVRDWLESTGWNKVPPPPTLPSEVVQATSDRYVQAYERLSGLALTQWWGA